MDVNRILVYRGLCGVKLESQCLAIGFTYILIALTSLLVTRYLNLKLLYAYIYKSSRLKAKANIIWIYL